MQDRSRINLLPGLSTTGSPALKDVHGFRRSSEHRGRKELTAKITSRDSSDPQAAAMFVTTVETSAAQRRAIFTAMETRRLFQDTVIPRRHGQDTPSIGRLLTALYP